MKLATLKDGSRDGSLAAVSRDLSKAVVAETAVPGLKTLQQLMDNWESTQPKVAQICADLNKSANGGLAAPLSVDFEGTRALHHCSALSMARVRKMGPRVVIPEMARATLRDQQQDPWPRSRLAG